MWQYYYDADADETIYYHDGEEVTTLDGKESKWRKGIPYGNHLYGIKEAFQQTGTPKRIGMTYDLHIGFEELSEPLNGQ